MMSRKTTVRLSKSLRMDQLIFPLIFISISALFSYAQQGNNCDIDLQCFECNETAANKYCTKCAAGNGFVIDPPNATKCARCGQGCTTCSVIGEACLQCRPNMGPYLSGSNIGSCGACSTDEQCNGRCDNKGAGRCDSCELEYGLTNDGTTCSPCVPHCVRCDTNITYCDLCDDNYFFYPNKSCGLCSQNCRQGCQDNGAGKCDRCDVGYGLTPAKTCDPCAPNCTTCAVNGAGKCDRCDTGFNLTPTNTCTPICAPNCTKCVVNGPWECDQCDNGFRLTSAKNCTPICAPNCTICYANGPGKCDQCDKGFTLTSYKNCTPICAWNCTTCAVSGSWKCDQCDKGFTLTSWKNCTPMQTTVGASSNDESSRPSLSTVRSNAYGWTTAMTTWTITPDQGISSFGGDIACPMLEVGLGLGVPSGFIIIVLLILIIVFCVQNRSLRAYKKESQDNMQIQAMDSTTSNAAPQPTSTQYQQLRMQDTQRDYEKIEDKYDTISTTETEIGVISDTVNHVSRRATLLPIEEDKYDTVSRADTEITGQYETPIN